MAASRKKRAKPRKNVKVKAKPRTAAPAGLKALDAGWRSFISHATEDKPLTEAWSDPTGVTSRPRKAAKKAAKKKPTAKPRKAAKKKAPAKAKKKAAKK